MKVFPRIILVIFLMTDVLYFYRIELFYKVILWGTLPFIFRYINYSIKSVYKFLIKTLNDLYSNAILFEKDYAFDIERSTSTNAVFHYEKKSIEECIDIQYENLIAYASNKV